MEAVDIRENDINQEIQNVIENTNRIAQIEIGSDAYLDKVLQFKERFDVLNSAMSGLNEAMIVRFSRLHQEPEDEQLLLALKALHQILVKTINHYKIGIYGKALKTTIEATRIETSQLREIIDDEKLKVSIKANERIQSLFSQM